MKKRVISAIVALAIVIPLIILGGLWFYIGAGLIGVIGFNEMLMARDKKKKIPVLMKLLSMISFVVIMLSSINSTYEFVIDYKFIAIPFLLCLTPIIFYIDSGKYDIEDALYLLGSIFFLGVSFNFLITIRNMNLYYFLYLIIITIMTDTFAHFFGTQIGKHKLCPKVSPNKTIEGFIGGLLFGTFMGTMFYTTMLESNLSLLVIILITMLLSIMASMGDLVFSAMKRHFNIKDFGNIMPGHGGVLDRVDSILFAALTMALFISIL